MVRCLVLIAVLISLNYGVSCENLPATRRVGDKLYYVNAFLKANFYKASEFCQYNGMELGSIDNTDEYYGLIEYIKSFNMNSDEQRFWTSATNLGSGNQFVWMSTGLPMNISEWEQNEPSNSDNTEHCMIIEPSYQFNDISCDDSGIFSVCQYQDPVITDPVEKEYFNSTGVPDSLLNILVH